MRADRIFRVVAFTGDDGLEVVGPEARGSLFIYKKDGEDRAAFVRDMDGSAVGFSFVSYGTVPTMGLPQRSVVVFQCPSGRMRSFTAYKELEGGEVDLRVVSEVEVMTGAAKAIQIGGER